MLDAKKTSINKILKLINLFSFSKINNFKKDMKIKINKICADLSVPCSAIR